MNTNALIALAGVILALPAAILAFLQILDRRATTSPKMPTPTSVPAQSYSVTPHAKYAIGKFGLLVSSMIACVSSIALAIMIQIDYEAFHGVLPPLQDLMQVLTVGLILSIVFGVCEILLVICAVQRKQAGWLFVLLLSILSGFLSIFWPFQGVAPVWLYPSWILAPTLYGLLTRE